MAWCIYFIVDELSFVMHLIQITPSKLYQNAASIDREEGISICCLAHIMKPPRVHNKTGFEDVTHTMLFWKLKVVIPTPIIWFWSKAVIAIWCLDELSRTETFYFNPSFQRNWLQEQQRDSTRCSFHQRPMLHVLWSLVWMSRHFSENSTYDL